MDGSRYALGHVWKICTFGGLGIGNSGGWHSVGGIALAKEQTTYLFRSSNVDVWWSSIFQ